MTPYYEQDGITIYHGDCRELIDAWNVDGVMVTDPPYGTQFTDANPSGGYGRRQNADNGAVGFVIANDGDTTIRDEVLRLWSPKPMAVFGSPRMPDPPGEWVDRLVWDKTRPGMNGGPWRYRHETIYVTAGFVRIDNYQTSIIAVWPDQSDHIHAKPVELMARLVGAARPGVIVDPFMGSGTTLRAAKDLGRQAIGIEIEERYCEIAANRLAQGVLDFGQPL